MIRHEAIRKIPKKIHSKPFIDTKSHLIFAQSLLILKEVILLQTMMSTKDSINHTFVDDIP